MRERGLGMRRGTCWERELSSAVVGMGRRGAGVGREGTTGSGPGPPVPEKGRWWGGGCLHKEAL